MYNLRFDLDNLKRVMHENELYEKELTSAKQHLMQGVDLGKSIVLSLLYYYNLNSLS